MEEPSQNGSAGSEPSQNNLVPQIGSVVATTFVAAVSQVTATAQPNAKDILTDFVKALKAQADGGDYDLNDHLKQLQKELSKEQHGRTRMAKTESLRLSTARPQNRPCLNRRKLPMNCACIGRMEPINI
jgi:hypothetical protein